MVTTHAAGTAATGGMTTGLTASLARSALVGNGLLSAGELRSRQAAREALTSGFTSIDALLPTGGLRRGSLVEWLAGGDGSSDTPADGSGAVTLACAVAGRLAAAACGPRTIVVVDRSGWFHPPAVLPWFDDSRQLVVARPSHDDDEIWAIDQALRCNGVAAVVAWPRSMQRQPYWSRETSADDGRRCGGSPRRSRWTTAMRRWQLAARSSGAIGLLVRPAAAISEPSWAEVRLAVSSLPGGTLRERWLRLEWVGGAWSGGREGQAVEIVLDATRGCEGSPTRRPGRGLATPRHEQTARSADRQGGASCRAS